MQLFPFPISRLAFAALALLALSACASRGPVGEAAGASSSGAAYLSQIRFSNGLSTLAYDSRLEQAALEQSGYMARAGSMTHTTGWRRDFATRMKANGVEGAAAENIAAGRFDTAKLFDMWMNSSGHRRNMLDPRFSRFGLAYVAGGKDGVRYWTLVLAR